MIHFEVPVSKNNLDLVLYEFNMLIICQPEKQLNKNDTTIHLEAFLIHARNLIDFIEDNRIKDTDLTCSDFSDTKGNKMEGTKIFDNDFKQTINKHLSHLTKERLDKKPYWEVLNIRNKINASLADFFEKISPDFFINYTHAQADIVAKIRENSLISITSASV